MQRKQRIFSRNAILTAFFSCLIFSSVHAAGPLWVFVPQTSTNITIAKGGNAQVIYTVKNKSTKAKNLVMKPVPGVSQSTACRLAPNGSCTLTLNVNGAALQGDVVGGPVLCQQGNDLQCYQPSSAHILYIRLTQPPVNRATLSPLTQNLALSINSPGADPALAGNQRIIRIQNTGSIPANNIQVSTTLFPTGTLITSNTCIGILSAGTTCDITITPGNSASENAVNSACTLTPGTDPVPTTVTVSADNAPSIDINVLVLGYGCIYQGGFLFSVDDTTPDTGSIGGKVAALTDEPTPLYMWSIVSDNTAADSLTNGLDNTNALTNPAGQYPAAQACLNSSNPGWFMPAICELGRYVGFGTDAGCGTTNPNLYMTLYMNNLGGFANDYYWSSSEFFGNPTLFAWGQSFNNGFQSSIPKGTDFRVRCVRSFTP